MSVTFFLKKIVGSIGLCLTVSLFTQSTIVLAKTSNWPNKAVTIIVPGSPGGTLDIPTRLIGLKLSERLGQSVVVDNRPGSGGILGTQALIRGSADGHTLLSGNTGPQAINYSAYKNLPYTPQELTGVIDVITFPNVLVVNASSSIYTVSDLIEEIKKNPGKFAFSSAGVGQTTHLTGELFKIVTETEALHVPYKGSAPATMALLGNEVNFQFDNLVQAIPHIKGGKLRPLAVTSPTRSPILPDVPTMQEAGIKDFVAMGWMGMFVKAGTPQAIVDELNSHFSAILKEEEVREKLKELGGFPGEMTQAEFALFLEQEQKRWADTIKAANIKLD